MSERIHARGHENVTATHESTLEITSDDYLTPAGDCILAVDADRVPADFDSAFVAACQDRDATITAQIECGSRQIVVTGHGHPALTFDNERSLVVRTSEYVDDRTVMVAADAAAGDLDREFVSELTNGTPVTLTLSVE